MAGDTKSGKSWLAGLLVEQQILLGYTVYAFDPEGDYSSLATLPNTVVLGGGRFLPYGDDLTMLLSQGLNIVLNLSHLEHHQKLDYIRHHLPLVATHRREQGFSHRILLDECHYFLDDPHSEKLLDAQLDGYTLVTYRPSRLPPSEEAEGKLRRFVVAPRMTTHVRHRTKYFDTPVRAGREFVFTDFGQHTGASAATLRELRTVSEHVDAKVLAGHCRHHDFPRWIGNLFSDRELAKDVRKIESKHRHQASAESFAAELGEIIEQRYESS